MERPLYTDDAFEARLVEGPSDSPPGSPGSSGSSGSFEASRHLVVRLPPAARDASLPLPADAALLRLVRLEQAVAFGSPMLYPQSRFRPEPPDFRCQAREAERHGALLRLLGVSLASSGVRCGSAQQRVSCAAVRLPSSSSPELLFLEAARCVERWAESQTSATECSADLTLSVDQGSIVMALYDVSTMLGSHLNPPAPEWVFESYDDWTRSWFTANGPVINAIFALVSVAQSSPSSPPSPPLRLVRHYTAAHRGRAHLWELVLPAYVLFQGDEAVAFIEVDNRDRTALARTAQPSVGPSETTLLKEDRLLIQKCFVHLCGANVAYGAVLGDFGRAFMPFELHAGDDGCHHLSFADEAVRTSVLLRHAPQRRSVQGSSSQVQWCSGTNIIMSLVKWALFAAHQHAEHGAPLAQSVPLEERPGAEDLFSAGVRSRLQAARQKEEDSTGPPRKRLRSEAPELPAAEEEGKTSVSTSAAILDADAQPRASRSVSAHVGADDHAALTTGTASQSLSSGPDVRERDEEHAGQQEREAVTSDTAASRAPGSPPVPGVSASNTEEATPTRDGGSAQPFLYTALFPHPVDDMFEYYQGHMSSRLSEPEPDLPQTYLRTAAPADGEPCVVKVPCALPSDDIYFYDEHKFDDAFNAVRLREAREEIAVLAADKDAEQRRLLQREVAAYEALAALQGTAIARMLYAGALSLRLRGDVHCALIIEAGGEALDTLDASAVPDMSPAELRAAVEHAHAQLHAHGWCHGQVQRCNMRLFADTKSVRLVGLEYAERTDRAADHAAEMREVRALLDKWLGKVGKARARRTA